MRSASWLIISSRLLAFVPWFFSWTGVVLALLGLYVFGTLGINLCYHRLLTHRGLVTPKPLEHVLAILGVCCFQETPARWVAVHRRHHQHADEQPDPHSPLVNFFWGHMGWIMVENDELNRLGIFERYSKDVLRDKFYAKLERNNWWVWVLAISWAVFFLAGFAVELIRDGGSASAIAVRRERAGVGRVRAHGSGVAHHLVGELGDAPLGLPELRDR